MKLLIITVLFLISTSAGYADTASVTDQRVVALELSDTGEFAVLIMDFQATPPTPEGSDDNAGDILMVLKKLEDAWMIFADFACTGPASPLSNLKIY